MNDSLALPAKDKRAYFHMLWASLAFALMAAFSHWAGEYCDWQLVVVARAVIAFVFAVMIAKFAGVSLIWFGPLTLWVRSLGGSLGMLCNFYALAHLPVSDTLTLMNTSPVWVTLWLWLFFGEKPKLSLVFAVLLSVGGIVLIQQPHFAGGKFACAMALCGAFCTSIVMLGLTHLHHLDSRVIVAHFSGVASLVTIGFLFFTHHENSIHQLNSVKVWLLLALVGAAGVAGQIGMTKAFAIGPATQIAVVALSQILFGLVFDMLFWNRSLNGISLLGMVLVIVPTAWLILGKTPQQSHDLTEIEMED